MNIALYIARRYLFSAKSKNAVNIITAISVLGVAIGTLALVVVMSVFSGFESLIKSMYQQVNSDFEITALRSKHFSFDQVDTTALKDIAVWENAIAVYEEKVLLKLDDREQIAKLRGVENLLNTSALLPIESHILKGTSFRDFEKESWAIIGQSLAYTLSASVQQDVVKVFVPNPKAKANTLNEAAFIETSFGLSGVYTVQAEYDASYMVCSLQDVQSYLNREGRLTSLELHAAKGVDLDAAQEQLSAYFGPDYEVKNRFQQQAFLYKVLKTEKWAIFFILSFILLIATFNIVASVIMIVLEKRSDVNSLWAMGAPQKMIHKIFFYEGLLITFFGGGIGLTLGVALCLLQQQFGLIALGNQGSFIINAYPVEVQLTDVFLIMATVLTIGVAVTYIPAFILKRKILKVT